MGQKMLGKIRSIAGALMLSVSLGVAPAALAAQPLSSQVSSEGSSSYAAIVQRAERAALELVQQQFAADPNLSEVSVQVIGEHNGLEAPLLSVTVSRADWQRNPDIRAQARYFGRSSAVLLGLLPSGGSSPAPVPVASRFDPVAAALTDIEPNFYD